MSDYIFDAILKMILKILDGCESIEDAKAKIKELMIC